ncbi:MAG: 3-mercaptopyruvate sulfurtransferase [Sphingobium sp.]|nr:3-mercaptopyruvate sulfurtransferase [Sphingobium sp.]MBP6112472.1 3-mercaptopyruvate sulfurtransferase [Sphingobium sp.]MBP8672110.1 3-mercaptopyruvate sulfurtransferase [Sphingobium sp.]MBP9158824.1 3-mercaptopyruvate sulfurtransferase [Sphingobium sp.]MCC6481714.1 3-mercaptopyruvate sulfurtransferase [Sphingomonadaceae bacterium]
MDILVSTDWLAENMGASELRIVDASYFLPEMGRDASAEYEAQHIPGAVFLNLAELADATSPLANTVPQPEKFASRMQALGLGDGSRIVLYDNSPLKSAARAWWLFELFGAPNIAILDGGLGKWIAEKREVESGKQQLRHRHFTVWRDDKAIASKHQVLENIGTKAAQVVDARTMSRFTAEEPEVRPGMASGHIPGSVCLPYSRLFNTDGTWKRGHELKGLFIEAGVTLDKPLITSCGSGVTAACVLFGARLLGKKDVTLYDGSWADWGSDPATPKATGNA